MWELGAFFCLFKRSLPDSPHNGHTSLDWKVDGFLWKFTKKVGGNYFIIHYYTFARLWILLYLCLSVLAANIKVKVHLRKFNLNWSFAKNKGTCSCSVSLPFGTNAMNERTNKRTMQVWWFSNPNLHSSPLPPSLLHNSNFESNYPHVYDIILKWSYFFLFLRIPVDILCTLFWKHQLFEQPRILFAILSHFQHCIVLRQIVNGC